MPRSVLLLRALETGEVQPFGSVDPVAIDGRGIAASSLMDAVDARLALHPGFTAGDHASRARQEAQSPTVEARFDYSLASTAGDIASVGRQEAHSPTVEARFDYSFAPTAGFYASWARQRGQSPTVEARFDYSLAITVGLGSRVLAGLVVHVRQQIGTFTVVSRSLALGGQLGLDLRAGRSE